MNEDDGPTKELKRFMEYENNGQVPEKWQGYRDIDY